MTKIKKILCLVLALCLCLTLCTGAFAQNDAEYKDYPNVFVHGLFGWGEFDDVNDYLNYWGLTSGDMMRYLSNKGYTVASASVGPISSCWDRCCELFAQLTGTRTDYGAAHVEKTLRQFAQVGCDLPHERYGHDYSGEAIISGWGPIYEGGKVTGWYDNKINLIGHSFGGPTITMFLELLSEGNEAERNAAKAEAEEKGGNWKDYCSPLFWGDYEGEKLVNSLTSLAGVLNGTTFIDSCDDSTQIITSLALMAANVIGDTVFNSVYDFQLEQFGITKSDNPDYEYVLDVIRAANFLDGEDNAIYDLSVEGCNKLKQGWECFDNVFYFAYPGCTSIESSVTGNQVPGSKTWPLFFPFSTFMGSYTNANEYVTDIYGSNFTAIDKAWLPNDGMVNTISASYVFGCPHKDYDGSVEPGMWITMPTYGYDHLDFIGGVIELTQNTWQTTAYFDEIMSNIISTYNYSERLDAPVLGVSNIKYSNSVKLTWNAVEGADGYKLYRASSKDGSYSFIGTTPFSHWFDVTAVVGRTYYYKMTAIKSGSSDLTSDYSNTASIKVTLK